MHFCLRSLESRFQNALSNLDTEVQKDEDKEHFEQYDKDSEYKGAFIKRAGPGLANNSNFDVSFFVKKNHRLARRVKQRTFHHVGYRSFVHSSNYHV